jgi:cytidylate kinase
VLVHDAAGLDFRASRVQHQQQTDRAKLTARFIKQELKERDGSDRWRPVCIAVLLDFDELKKKTR